MPLNSKNINSFCSPISMLALVMIFKRPVLTSVPLPEKVQSAGGNKRKLSATSLIRFTIKMMIIWLYLSPC